MARQAPRYLDRITRDPAVMVGKPVVKGTRIPVELVLDELAHNPSLEELLAAHPDLTREDVKACLAYAQELVRKQRPRREATLAGAPPAK